MQIDGADRFYTTWCRESDWNGIPAYVKYVRDVTEEVKTRKEKERLEQYFQTVVKTCPAALGSSGMKRDGKMTPEFLSDGFAAMTGMTLRAHGSCMRKMLWPACIPGCCSCEEAGARLHRQRGFPPRTQLPAQDGRRGVYLDQKYHLPH